MFKSISLQKHIELSHSRFNDIAILMFTFIRKALFIKNLFNISKSALLQCLLIYLIFINYPNDSNFIVVSNVCSYMCLRTFDLFNVDSNAYKFLNKFLNYH